jgi:pimeloyl-ACP methyl ester carboxylesterase
MSDLAAHTNGSPTVVLVSHRVLDGIGHNVPQEAPEVFADAILEVGGAK